MPIFLNIEHRRGNAVRFAEKVISDKLIIVYFKRLDSRQNELSVFGHVLNGYYAKLIHGVLGQNGKQVSSLYLINF